MDGKQSVVLHAGLAVRLGCFRNEKPHDAIESGERECPGGGILLSNTFRMLAAAGISAILIPLFAGVGTIAAQAPQPRRIAQPPAQNRETVRRDAVRRGGSRQRLLCQRNGKRCKT